MTEESSIICSTKSLSPSQARDLKKFYSDNYSVDEADLICENIFLFYQKGILVFVLSFDIEENLCEIYDVCTDAKFRRQGIATRALSLFIRKNLADVYWLGVEEKELAPLYEKIGFRKLHNTNKSPLGREFSFTFSSFGLFNTRHE